RPPARTRPDAHAAPRCRPRRGNRVLRSRDRHARQEHPPQAGTRSAQSDLSADGIRRRLQVRGAMMPRRSSGRHCAPPCWPANEPWRPVRGGRMWRRRRIRFVGAMLVFLLPMFILFSLGVAAFAAVAIRRLGAPPQVLYLTPAFAWMVIVFLFVFGLRHV